MLIKCFKCQGRKKMYKVNSTYTMVDFAGSKPVDCPECGGIGKVLSDDEKEAMRLKAEGENVIELPRVDKRSKQSKELKKRQEA